MRNFLLLLLPWVALGQDTCQRTSCKNVNGSLITNYASMKKVSDKKYGSTLTVYKQFQTSQKSQKERERECVGNCTIEGTGSCLSAHLSPYGSNGPSTCTLFKEDSYKYWVRETSSELANIREVSAGWTSFHVLNSFCERNPCHTPSRCIPDFTTDTGTCECDGGRIGKHCQHFDPLKATGVGHWVFDNYAIENIGKGVSTMGNGIINPTHGTILGVPDRKGNVIQCDAKGSVNLNSYCFQAPESGKHCISNFDSEPACPTGFTYGFWFRVTQFDGQDSTNKYLMSQSDRDAIGLAFLYGAQPALYYEFGSYYFMCSLSEYKGKFHIRWNLFAFAHDPISNKYYCFINQDRKEMAKYTGTQYARYPFGFNGEIPFYVDDVFLLPYFATPATMEHIYNQTRKGN